MPYLDVLVAGARRRVRELESTQSAEVFEQRIAGNEPPRGFAAALSRGGTRLIAEIKRASPSAGDLALDLNPGELAAAYAHGGADALSVLTEPDLFKGSLEDMSAARSAGIPVLRKDFILDPVQILESRAWGADAILLIVRILGPELAELLRAAQSTAMDVMVEVHDESELDRALDAGARIIGVNHRDLATFEVDPERTAKLAPMIPADRLLVSLSGMSSASDVRRAREAGAGAVLVGEGLVTAADPGARIAELLKRA